MAHSYDLSCFCIDFSTRTNLTDEDKKTLATIQETLRPIERAESLTEFVIQGKITGDEYEKLTGLPYRFGGF